MLPVHRLFWKQSNIIYSVGTWSAWGLNESGYELDLRYQSRFTFVFCVLLGYFFFCVYQPRVQVAKIVVGCRKNYILLALKPRRDAAIFPLVIFMFASRFLHFSRFYTEQIYAIGTGDPFSFMYWWFDSWRIYIFLCRLRIICNILKSQTFWSLALSTGHLSNYIVGIIFFTMLEVLRHYSGFFWL